MKFSSRHGAKAGNLVSRRRRDPPEESGKAEACVAGTARTIEGERRRPSQPRSPPDLSQRPRRDDRPGVDFRSTRAGATLASLCRIIDTLDADRHRDRSGPRRGRPRRPKCDPTIVEHELAIHAGHEVIALTRPYDIRPKNQLPTRGQNHCFYGGVEADDHPSRPRARSAPRGQPWKISATPTSRRNETFTAVKNLYHARSSVVHGTTSKSGAARSHELDGVRDLLRRSLVGLMAVRSAAGSEDECIRLLKTAIFDRGSQFHIERATEPVWRLIDSGPEWRQNGWGPKYEPYAPP